MKEINNNLITLIRELNKVSEIINEDSEKMDNRKDNEQIDLSTINRNLDFAEDLVIKIVKTEPDPVLRSLHFELATSIDKEEYEKCQEVSDKIKNYKMETE